MTVLRFLHFLTRFRQRRTALRRLRYWAAEDRRRWAWDQKQCIEACQQSGVFAKYAVANE